MSAMSMLAARAAVSRLTSVPRSLVMLGRSEDVDRRLWDVVREYRFKDGRYAGTDGKVMG